jgi:hypothetical protein
MREHLLRRDFDSFFRRLAECENFFLRQLIQWTETFAFETAFRVGRFIGARIVQADQIDGQFLLHVETNGRGHTAHDVDGVLFWQSRVELLNAERKRTINANNFLTINKHAIGKEIYALSALPAIPQAMRAMLWR